MDDLEIHRACMDMWHVVDHLNILLRGTTDLDEQTRQLNICIDAVSKAGTELGKLHDILFRDKCWKVTDDDIARSIKS